MNSKLNQIVKELYADTLTIADLSNYQNELRKFGGDIVTGYSFGISIGIAVSKSIISGLNNGTDANNASIYNSHGYGVILDRLNYISSVISSFLSQQGYDALPIPSAERTNINNATPSVSHKMIGVLGGLGWVGKSGLLINKDFGSRLKLVTILTNAPLIPTGSHTESLCGSCSLCSESCPAEAIKGVNFNRNMSREHIFDFNKCQDYVNTISINNKDFLCGKCLYICPYNNL